MDYSEKVIDVFDKNASIYQEKYMDVQSYSKSLDLFCDHISKTNADILDIACGPGNVTKYLLNKRPDLQILGIDLAPNMLELARKNNPSANFISMDCRDIRHLNQKYDGIMVGFCLPYLNKEEALKLIADSAALLNSNGILYISTMEDNYENSRIQTSSQGDQLFMYFHQADYLTAALKANNFNIIHLNRLPQPTHLASYPPDLVIVAELTDGA